MPFPPLFATIKTDRADLTVLWRELHRSTAKACHHLLLEHNWPSTNHDHGSAEAPGDDHRGCDPWDAAVLDAVRRPRGVFAVARSNGA